MKRRRADLIKVGIFVLVSGAVLVGGLLWIAGSHLLRPVDSYTVLFDRSVTGLTAGANVEYKGVVVGRVRDIRLTADLPPLAYFILPGGSLVGAQLHVARTVCRRAERLVTAMNQHEAVGNYVLPYLNRLSDFLFTLARWENLRAGISDERWSVKF